MQLNYQTLSYHRANIKDLRDFEPAASGLAGARNEKNVNKCIHVFHYPAGIGTRAADRSTRK
jgi:hypothetical protein